MTTERRVVFYQDATGKEPFNDWLRSLRDARARRRGCCVLKVVIMVIVDRSKTVSLSCVLSLVPVIACILGKMGIR